MILLMLERVEAYPIRYYIRTLVSILADTPRIISENDGKYNRMLPPLLLQTIVVQSDQETN